MTPQKNEWEFFFDRHAPNYMDKTFTKNTHAEVIFIIEELKLPTGSHILDVGCGTGRHAIELARRGYRMTGVDISTGMLKAAQRLCPIRIDPAAAQRGIPPRADLGRDGRQLEAYSR